MTFTSPTDDIILQEGTFAFDFDASGTVNAGQAVYINGTMAVAAVPAATQKGIAVGVAAYTTTNGNPVAVFGPGNICRVIVSGTTRCVQGDILCPTYEGKFAAVTGNPSGVKAIALETITTDGGTARVLLM